MSNDTPSFEEMIEQARSWPDHGYGEGRWFNLMADEMERMQRLIATLSRACSRYDAEQGDRP